MNENHRGPGEARMHCPDILRWMPPTWELFLGNTHIKKGLRNLLKAIREQSPGRSASDLNKPPILLTGPSRSGKTSLVSFFIRCLSCRELDGETLNPCDGRCEACRQKPEIHGDAGIFSFLRQDDRRLHLHSHIIDATMIEGPSDLRGRLRELRDLEGIRIVYIDEVHRLVRREMDEILLKAIEEKGFIWIFSTAKPEGLEDMFLNRVLKYSTNLPESRELDEWLVDRCEDWRIPWEPGAILGVVERSNRIVGTALHALALAGLDPTRGLTRELVEEDWSLSADPGSA